MKNIFFFILSFIFIYNLQAQEAPVSQGNKVLGGSVLYDNSNTDATATNAAESSSTISVVPSFGYFIGDSWMIGLSVGYQTINSDEGISTSEQNTFSVNPFARYYRPIKEGSFYLYFQASAGVGFGSQSTTDATGTTTTEDVQTTNFALSPGFSFFPSSKWSIDLTFQGIVYGTVNPGGTLASTTTIQFGLDSFNPSLGMFFYF